MKTPYKLLIISLAATIVGMVLLHAADSTYDPIGDRYSTWGGILIFIGVLLVVVSSVWIGVKETVSSLSSTGIAVVLVGVLSGVVGGIVGNNIHGWSGLLLVLAMVYVALGILIFIAAAIKSALESRRRPSN